MKTRQPSRPPLSVGFVSLGCAKNLVDSQIMAGHLVDHQVVLASSPEQADIVIVNTCAFIQDAREESVEAILSACRLKQEGPCRAVIIAGCLSQRYREELQHSLPEVDALIGLDELDTIAEVVERVASGETRIMTISKQSRRLYEPPASGVVFSGGAHAYLKIAEGCNHRCAFCAIPGIRGRYRSRPVDRLVAEAERLLDAGFRELDLISQDVMAYGCDRRDEDSLVELLRALGRLGGDFWVRLLYGYPTGVTRELLDVMGNIPQVCHYLDVPIQHRSPTVLRRMRRVETIDPVRDMVSLAREVLPDIALRTTCLVGFPGETDAHFEELLAFVTEVRFDHVGAFAFSPEKGTPSFAMSHRPSAALAGERRERLLAAQQSIVRRNGQALLGQPARVLLERPIETGERWAARSARQAPEVDGQVLITHVPVDAQAGDFLNVRYTATAGYDLEAEPAR